MMPEAGRPQPPPADIAEQAQQFVGRDWVGDRIARWLAGSATVLLITGEPGAGKTTVAAQALATSRGEALLGALTPGFLNAAHFCRQFQTESVDPVSVLEHISGQLAETVSGYLKMLGLLAGQNQSSITVGHIDQQVRYAQNSTVVGIQIRIENPDPRFVYHRLIRGPLRRLHEEGRHTRDVVVLIDGLDETVEGATGTHFAARLAQELAQPVPGLRLCLTSRPGTAADWLSEIADRSGGCERIDLTASQPVGTDDVYRYAERRLSSLAPGQPGRSLARSIAYAAHGNFLYARAAIDAAARQTRHANDTIQLPTELAGVYAAYLDRELSLDAAAWEQRYRPILGALAQSLDGGLSARHLERITGLPQPVIDDALRTCAPYLHRTPGEETFRPYHESFRDYLRTDGRHYTYPGHATQAIVTRLCAPWHGRWHDCDDKYILRNLAAHLGDLVQLGGERSLTLANEMLRSVIADAAFRHAAERVAGKEKLIIDLDRIELEKIGHTIRRPGGHPLFLEDEHSNFAILIKRGHVKILAGSPPRLAAIRGPGDIVGDIAAFSGRPRTASVITVDDVEALYLPAAEWLNHLRDHPWAVGARLANAERAILEFADAGLAVEQQLARMLFELAHKLGEYTAGGVILRLSLCDLADLIGTKKIDPIKVAVRKFSAAGIIHRSRGQITILNLDALRDIATDRLRFGPDQTS
jgi:CRP/FNR family transcriptional regulator, cyclic AMP receptor protein